MNYILLRSPLLITPWLVIMLVGTAKAQIPVDLCESTFKIGAFDEAVLYYGFCEGDQLVFNFEERRRKKLKELEIVELPGSSKFMDFKAKAVSNKVINIQRTGIYKFRFANSAMKKRICKVKIQRLPLKEETKNFNSSVFWRELRDTTFYPVQEHFLVRSDTVVREIYAATPQISSRNAFNSNPSRQVVDFILPEHTVSWSFYIACGDKGKAEYEKAKVKCAQSAAKVISTIPGYGPLAALAINGFSYFSAVQGEDNVKYWFLADGNSAAAFMAEQLFSYYKKGDVINEASQMQYPLGGKMYLALANDNTFEPIKVTVKIVAVIVNQQWGTRIIQKMSINTRQEPYLQN